MTLFLLALSAAGAIALSILLLVINVLAESLGHDWDRWLFPPGILLLAYAALVALFLICWSAWEDVR